MYFIKHCVIVWMHYEFVFTSRSFLFQMIREMASSNKGEAPDMGDLSDVSAVCSFCLKWNMNNNHQWQELLVVGFMNYHVVMFIIWMYILMFIRFLLPQSDWSFLSSEGDVTESHVFFKAVCNIYCKISYTKKLFLTNVCISCIVKKKERYVLLIKKSLSNICSVFWINNN